MYHAPDRCTRHEVTPQVPSGAGPRAPGPEVPVGAVPVVVATVLRRTGGTGVQTHFKEFVRYLDTQAVPSTVVTPFSAGGVLRDAVFAVRRVLAPLSGAASVAWYRSGHRLFLERALRRELKNAGDVVVYCQCPVSAAAALRVRRGPNQRVVMAVHFWVSQADEWAGKGELVWDGRAFGAIRRLEREVIGELDGVVFVSEAAHRDLWTTVPEGVRTATIPNFLGPVEAGTGSPAHRGDLVTVGALEPRKNHRYLLDVLAAARRNGHDYTLDIVGEGPEARPLARRTKELGIEDRVRLLGYVPNAASLLAGYRGYVHPARHEPFGLAVLEAMRAGVPPVAAPVGGVTQIFDAGVEGLHFDLEDPEQGARSVVDLLDHEAMRLGMGEAARRRYLEQFDAAVVAPRLYEFLCSVVAPDDVALSRSV
jgi:glycosyltransferase involved in cell wall biosynthesis